MKQNITTKQLNELSKKGKERLRKWWKSSKGDIFTWHDGYKIEDGLNWYVDVVVEDGEKQEVLYPSGKKTKRYPLLSIGQMIEFLVEKQDKRRKDLHIEMLRDRWEVSTCYDETWVFEADAPHLPNLNIF